jgi:hypothetical protein
MKIQGKYPGFAFIRTPEKKHAAKPDIFLQAVFHPRPANRLTDIPRAAIMIKYAALFNIKKRIVSV